MAPAALFFVALIAGRGGVAGGLPVLDLYLPDYLGLEAEWLGLFGFYGIRNIHDSSFIGKFARSNLPSEPENTYMPKYLDISAY